MYLDVVLLGLILSAIPVAILIGYQLGWRARGMMEDEIQYQRERDRIPRPLSGKPFPRFGQLIEWRNSYGNRDWVESFDCDSAEEARQTALTAAIRRGWTPPRWWQVYRWKEAYWHWSKEDRQSARSMVENAKPEISPDSPPSP